MTTQAQPLISQAPPKFDLTTAVKDADFIKAPIQHKIAFLSAHDADFAKAKVNDQMAYLDHLLGQDQSSAAKPYLGFSPSNLWGNVKRGVTELGKGAYETGKDVLFPEGETEGEKLSFLAKKYILNPADIEAGKAQSASTASESVGHSIAAAIPFLGPWAASLGEQAGTGDVGGAAARGGTQIATTAAAGAVAKPFAKVIKKVLPSAEDVGLAARTEKGTLKPAVRGAARLAGTFAGHATGVPGAEFAGLFGAPAIADAVIPKRPFDIPTKGAAPGASLPATDEFFANRAKDLEARGKAQGVLDRAAARNAPKPQPASAFAGMTSTEKPIGAAEVPPPGSVELPKVVDARAKGAAKAPVISTPGQGAGPRFAGNEGRPATWTNERVMQLAKQGNREAIQQAVRRGMELPPNARYVAGDADFSAGTYNPRDVTVFGPEGTPIRQGGRVRPVAKPFSGAKAALPDLSNVPDVELVEAGGVRGNASGEPGGGGLEEQARHSAEAAAGVKYFRESPGGQREPLAGLGRQDLRAGPGQKIIRVDANGLETVLDAQPTRPASAYLLHKKPR